MTAVTYIASNSFTFQSANVSDNAGASAGTTAATASITATAAITAPLLPAATAATAAFTTASATTTTITITLRVRVRVCEYIERVAYRNPLYATTRADVATVVAFAVGIAITTAIASQ
jgi:hypothetical protein